MDALASCVGVWRCGRAGERQNLPSSHLPILPSLSATRSYVLSGLLVLLIGCVLTAGAPPAQAQERSLAEMLRAQRLHVQAAALVQQQGLHVQPLPAEALGTPTLDSLRAYLQRGAGRPAPAEPGRAPTFAVHGHQQMNRLTSGWFEERFADVEWTFLGNEGLTPVDTTYTRVLRARLEAAFGAPTLTLADYVERAGVPPEQIVQFEYWFVVNDTIPLMVMDTGGPFDRGLVVASDRRYRDSLMALRRSFLRPVATSSERAPYVDYYYDAGEQAWYRTGFDGQRYFLRRVRATSVLPGRRPWLEQ